MTITIEVWPVLRWAMGILLILSGLLVFCDDFPFSALEQVILLSTLLLGIVFACRGFVL